MQWALSLGVLTYAGSKCRVKNKKQHFFPVQINRPQTSMKYGSAYLSSLWQWCCEISAFAELPVLVSLCVSWLRISISIIYIIAGLSILREAYRVYEYHVITFAL